MSAAFANRNWISRTRARARSSNPIRKFEILPQKALC